MMTVSLVEKRCPFAHNLRLYNELLVVRLRVSFTSLQESQIGQFNQSSQGAFLPAGLEELTGAEAAAGGVGFAAAGAEGALETPFGALKAVMIF
jgi:hypothetical protein